MCNAGLQNELLAAKASKDSRTRGLAGDVISGLGAFGAWLRACHACGAAEGEEGQFRVCGGCKQRVYCGRECQVAGWKAGHKQECKALEGR